MLVGNYTSDHSDFGTNGRHRRNLGFDSKESRAEFRPKFVRTDNYGHLHTQAAAGAAMYWILRLQRLLKNVHGAACLSDVQRRRRRVVEKVHRSTGSKGEIKRDATAIYRE